MALDHLSSGNCGSEKEGEEGEENPPPGLSCLGLLSLEPAFPSLRLKETLLADVDGWSTDSSGDQATLQLESPLPQKELRGVAL